MRERGEAGRRLLLFGFLTLFLELALIRFLAGNVWNLGFFPNLVLLAAFVGMGVGFVFHARAAEPLSARLFQASSWVLLALAAFVHYLRPTLPGFGTWGGEIGGEVYYTATPVDADGGALAALLLWFSGIVLLFALIAQRAAKLFRLFAPLHAYTLDISGSCLGILAFMAASWLELPAWTWFLLLVPVVAVLLDSGRLLAAAPLLAMVALAQHQDARPADGALPGARRIVRWSPYQKVELVTDGDVGAVYVNGIGHQWMEPPEALSGSIYGTPYHWREAKGLPPARVVLVIGAGTGNDVAAALRSGVVHVDAVEIDPVIARYGRDHHPAQPYADPRVRLVIADGRNFLNRTDRRYDLVILALTDSLVKVSPLAQLRLENYLFTRESMRRAFATLADHGQLVLYNNYRRPWITEKNVATIHAATGRAPLPIVARGEFVVLIAGQDVEGPPGAPASVAVTTDDWPFPYLRRRGLPSIYRAALAGLLGLILLLAVLVETSGLGRGAGGGTTRRAKAGFLLLGAAFLLLETKGVIQFSLLFGTTWFNSSLVFLAVLLLVLVANWAALAIRDRRLTGLAFAALLVACLLPLAFPLTRLLDVPSPIGRYALAGLYTFSPVFFASLMFSVSFREQPAAEHLFGWNLIGGALGGLLEYASMAIGYDALGLVVAACYTLAFLLLARPRALAPQ